LTLRQFAAAERKQAFKKHKDNRQKWTCLDIQKDTNDLSKKKRKNEKRKRQKTNRTKTQRKKKERRRKENKNRYIHAHTYVHL
jgi:hypothetical protein